MCIVLCPNFGTQAGLAIGASRAGGVGVLDIERSDSKSLQNSLKLLEQMLERTPVHRRLGLRCRSRDLENLAPLLDRLDGRPHLLLLHGDTPARLAASGSIHRREGCEGLWLEVHQGPGLAAVASPESGIDGLIACGQECGGPVGSESTFPLLQRLLTLDCHPVMVKGVPGVHSAAALRGVGAAGVVLDHQTLLLPESPLPKHWQALLENASPQSFPTLGTSTSTPVTVFNHPGFPAFHDLQRAVREAEAQEVEEQSEADLSTTVERLVRWGDPNAVVWPLGQTAGWAVWTKNRYRSIGHLVRDLLQQSRQQVELAARLQPLAPNSALADSLGTRFPIVQGPMTRVSDTPEFSRAVGQAGALPMVALALLDGPTTRDLLQKTQDLMGDLSWGVGILGFVPPNVREAQIQEILRVRPPFAVIAGGRPQQALELEKQGIATFLHAPVPALLKSFLQQGARRFILEGRECGGHVGPLNSMSLWEQSVVTLLEHLPPPEQQISVLFAGGIHDALSASVVATLAAPLVEKGVQVGVLMGTAYLFTKEAVQTGAITKGYQKAAIDCRETVTLESAPGQANRCAATPFVETFAREKRRLLKEGATPETVHAALDGLLLGRLRQASKGVRRVSSGEWTKLEPKRQFTDGMFMLGEAATLKGKALGLEDLHRSVSVESSAQLSCRASRLPEPAAEAPPQPCDVAIVGMALHVPGSPEAEQFWRNVLDRVTAIREVPKDRWDWELYFDENKSAPDRSYSKWGGFIDDLLVDPLSYGLPPNLWSSVNTSQIISLELARQALDDANFQDPKFPRGRTAAILASGDSGFLGGALLSRSLLPLLATEVDQDMLERLPEWTEDSFPGVLASLCSGRLANRLDLGGSNFVVDSACASSLTAVDMACHELTSGRADAVVVGGVDIGQTPFEYIGFSKVQALSPTGEVLPFDRKANGIVLSDGAAFVVLKRLDEAERNGDKIYAVIRSMGSSSDGRAMGLTAPSGPGQQAAMRTAWNRSGWRPDTLELYEAHATGTALGDRTELESISTLLNEAGASPGKCALGSIKSLVGHTKRAAGLVSLAKAALALHHRVLPPHRGGSEPLDALLEPSSPMCLYEAPQPWFQPDWGTRRAAVSAFGFGGTNGHAVLQEYQSGCPGHDLGAQAWPGELFLLGEQPGLGLAEQIRVLKRGLKNPDFRLRDLAYSLAIQASPTPSRGEVASVVAGSFQEFLEGLELLERFLQDRSQVRLPGHISYGHRAGTQAGKVAYLFPGQGSQYVSPSRDLVLVLPEFREALETVARCWKNHPSLARQDFLRTVFPPAALKDQQKGRQREALRDTRLAQPLLGALALASIRFLARLGFQPQAAAGHSYGEFSALFAAGVLSEQDLITLSQVRGEAMSSPRGQNNGSMAAVLAPREQVENLLKSEPRAVVANHNSPNQTVISGPLEALEHAIGQLTKAGYRCLKLPVGGGFHSPEMRQAQEPLLRTIRKLHLHPPEFDVYSNLNGRPYPADPAAILEQLQGHLMGAVEFVAQVEQMHSDGVRTFIEMAPGSVLTNLVREILPDNQTMVLSLDRQNEGLSTLLQSLGALRIAGVPWVPAALFDGRSVDRLDTLDLPQKAATSPTTWVVNSNFIRPYNQDSAKVGRRPFLDHRPAEASVKDKMPLHPPAKEIPVTSPEQPPRTQEQRPAVSGLPAGSAPSFPHPLTDGSDSNSTPSGFVSLADQRVLEAYQAYQQTMQQFLRTQESVMSSFLAQLSGSNGGLQASKTQEAPTQRPALPVSQMLQQNGPSPATELEPGPPAPVLEVAEEPSMAFDGEALLQTLVRLIAAKTGYPQEMLDSDADLEGHLGIDSIKRLEILDDLLRKLPEELEGEVRKSTDNLIRLRSLKELAMGVAELLEKFKTSNHSSSPPAASAPESAERFLMTGHPAPVPEGPPPAGLYLLLHQDQNLAAELDRALKSAGCHTLLVTPQELSREDWTLESDEPIAGILHLTGWSSDSVYPESFKAWHQQWELHTLSLYRLLSKLDRSRLEGACVVVGSRAGGGFGRDGQPGHGSPFSAGALGLARTLATERPELACRAVDLPEGLKATEMAARLMTELAGVEAEVGYPRGTRTVYLPESSPWPQVASADHPWSRQRVILASGGASGIGAHLLTSLAQPGQTFILVGRTELGEEPDELRGLLGAEDIRSALIESQKGTLPQNRVAPADLERMVRQALRRREIRQTLESLRESGCGAEYRAADLTVARTVKKLIKDVDTAFGPIDSYFHAAGLLEDRLFEDKSEESFRRVFSTKIDSLFHILGNLKTENLSLLVLFSSVAGRFGNRGQADYAAANECLNRLAFALQERLQTCRILSINWGPWADLGMATSSHQALFKSRGIEPITQAEGAGFLSRELQCDSPGDVEVIAGQGPWSALLESSAKSTIGSSPKRQVLTNL